MENMRDVLNLVSGITPARAANAAKVLSSYYRSRLTKTPEISGLPIALSFEPTTSCNLRCPECPSGLRSFTRPTGMLENNLFQKVIDELAPTLGYLTFYFQGEPFLNPQFLDMAGYAAQKGIYTATSTNAHYLTDANAKKTVESGLDRLIISIDGTTQKTYEAYRVGGNLEKVISGTKNILHWRSALKSATPHIIFQFLVVGHNEHQVNEVKALAKSLGVDEVRLKTAQIYDYESGSPLIPSDDRYARYRLGPDGRWHVKHKISDHCWKMWHSCVITWDGKVVPCCFDKDAQFRLGELSQQSFKEIWQGDAYRTFRQTLIQGRSEIEMCRNCTEGARVFA